MPDCSQPIVDPRRVLCSHTLHVRTHFVFVIFFSFLSFPLSFSLLACDFLASENSFSIGYLLVCARACHRSRYPVEIVSLGSVGPADIRSDKYITECVTASVEIHCTKPPGDILVFLTGQAEIASAARRLFKLSEELDYRTDVASRTLAE